MPRSLSKKLSNPLFIVIFLSIHTTAILHSQSDNKVSFTAFDQVIGKTNSGIFNGIQYFEKYRVINDKHKFFKHKFFIYGSVIYKNQPYFEIALKYDVHSDALLVKNSEILSAPITQLDKNYITQFELDGHLFKKLSFSLKSNSNVSGFFEILLTNDAISVFKKHQKKLSRIVDEETYYEFKDQFQYYIQYKNTYYLLKKVSLLSSIFPEYKTHIKNSFKKHEKLRKSNRDNYLLAVIDDLNAHMLNKI